MLAVRSLDCVRDVDAYLRAVGKNYARVGRGDISKDDIRGEVSAAYL